MNSLPQSLEDIIMTYKQELEEEERKIQRIKHKKITDEIKKIEVQYRPIDKDHYEVEYNSEFNDGNFFKE